MFTALDMYHYLETKITYNNCYSTAQSYTTGTSSTPYLGIQGFNLYTNRYHNITVDHNNIYNNTAPIIFTADIGNYDNTSGGVSNGRWGGQVTITNNFIRPHINNTYTITNQFVQLGIDAEDLMSTPSSYTNATESGTNINISNNTIDKAWYGIYANSFALQTVNTYSNYVTLVKALNSYTSPTQQYGINHSAVVTSTISVNSIDATSISNSDQSRNITTVSTGTVRVGCNVETGGWRGLEFNGTQIAWTALNSMSNNAQGWALDNSGIIGNQ